MAKARTKRTITPDATAIDDAGIANVYRRATGCSHHEALVKVAHIDDATKSKCVAAIKGKRLASVPGILNAAVAAAKSQTNETSATVDH
ncbi:hypothetical protein RMSM_00635 [Rhodopirellula maiorica SM1]|uniref:Uncharacterized protein n=1 Tax=Rhodopirellula maiorica SM1 TaxID=1265738 RepID=M5S8E5_9BACT|nr:hypothetical protein [Rhodopirellula maiorica]EMI22439.1 hypothetical protein RMSM_00635 [Rhodopirellula maiorica SM1]